MLDRLLFIHVAGTRNGVLISVSFLIQFKCTGEIFNSRRLNAIGKDLQCFNSISEIFFSCFSEDDFEIELKHCKSSKFYR